MVKWTSLASPQSAGKEAPCSIISRTANEKLKSKLHDIFNRKMCLMKWNDKQKLNHFLLSPSFARHNTTEHNRIVTYPPNVSLIMKHHSKFFLSHSHRVSGYGAGLIVMNLNVDFYAKIIRLLLFGWRFFLWGLFAGLLRRGASDHSFLCCFLCQPHFLLTRLCVWGSVPNADPDKILPNDKQVFIKIKLSLAARIVGTYVHMGNMRIKDIWTE